MFFISPAHAQEAAATASKAGFNFMDLIPFVMIAGIMYFLLIRPQQKKMKQHQETIANVQRGDRIVTAGGIVGTIHRVGNDNEIILEIEENVRVRLVKNAISQVLSKPEPMAPKTGKKTEEETDNQKDDKVIKLTKKSPARKKTSSTKK